MSTYECSITNPKKQLEFYKDLSEQLQVEKEQLNSLVNSCQEEIRRLKKHLEEKDTLIKQCELSVSNVMDCYCERTDCSGRIKDSKQYDSLVQRVENQQKEFIEYLENEIENQKSEIFENSLTSEDINLYIMRIKLLKCEEILSKFKSIIGSKE